ncbi:MAG: carboxypeptidase-like regulatory domain-containing protein [Planctomycetes bacterium]|nr:carboxypeptidase-like regulatory domain-containing protein [Planctomycetota bacterium]
MLLHKRFRCLLVAATSAGMLLSNSIVWAEGPAPAPSSVLAAPQMTDVELQAGGILAGRVVDAKGTGLSKTAVALRNGNTVVAETTTDPAGNFRFDSVRGGTYHVSSGGKSAMYRVWANRTAPPGASQGILMVPSQDVVVGQYNPMKYWLADPLVIGGIIAVGAGVPIILAQQNNDSGS